MRGSARAGEDRLPAIFLIHDLQGGGAERAFVHYLNHFRRIDPVAAVVRWRMELLPSLRREVPVINLAAPVELPIRPALRSGVGAASDAVPEAPSMPLWLLDLLSGHLPLQVLRKAFRLRTVVRETGARTVSTFLPQSHIIAALARGLLGGDLRVVVNVHEMVSDPLVYLHPPVDRVILQRFMRWFFPSADRLVAVSDGIRDDLVENFGVPPERVVVRHNPIDIGVIRRKAGEPLELPDPARPLVVAVGRLVKLKGFDTLVRAFASLPPDLDARLLILGEGEEREALERLVGELGLDGRVSLVGWQSNPWKYMARARVLVLSSLTEAFPNVIGEAMALGTPVIATDCSPGVRQYLEDGRTGLLVRARSPDHLSRELERLLRSPGLQRRLAERGRRRVEDFDVDSAVREYERTVLGVDGRLTPGGSRRT